MSRPAIKAEDTQVRRTDADFTDFGTSRTKQVLQDVDEIKFTMDDFLDLPHFDVPHNCFNLMSALTSNNEIIIEKINEEDIYVEDVDATGVTVKYRDLEIHFDKHQLLQELQVKCNLFETMNTNPAKEETNSLPKEEADENALGPNNTNAIKRFNDVFRLNRVVQLKNLTSFDDYRHEHAVGDIYKIK